MAATYWKMVAENIAKGLGPKTIGKLGTSGRFFARAGGVIGVGFMAYELFKSYKDNIESVPAYNEMVILQQELEKWGSAGSCIARLGSSSRIRACGCGLRTSAPCSMPGKTRSSA